MDFDWKGIVKTVAPMLGTAIGGPFGGMAAKVISNAVLGKDDATEEEIEEALKSGSPEVYANLKKADQDFKVRMKELGIQEKHLAVEDRGSARQMYATTRDKIVPILAGLTVAGFFATMTTVLMGKVSLESTILGFVLGQISAKTEQVYNFYFGSSAGSKEKTQALAARSDR